MKDNDKNRRKELAAKQKFHENMVLGSKFIQDWHLFPMIPVDRIEYAYDKFLRSFVLFLRRPTLALEIQDLKISLFGASRYPCFDSILDFTQAGFYGVIDNVARIDKLSKQEAKLYINKIKKQHHIYEINEPIVVLKISAASGEFYVNLSDMRPSFVDVIQDKAMQCRRTNSVLNNLDLNRMTLDLEVFSAMNFIGGYDDVAEYYEMELGEEDIEDIDDELKSQPGDPSSPHINISEQKTLEVDESRTKDSASESPKKNDKPKGKPKGKPKDGKKRKKKP